MFAFVSSSSWFPQSMKTTRPSNQSLVIISLAVAIIWMLYRYSIQLQRCDDTVVFACAVIQALVRSNLYKGHSSHKWLPSYFDCSDQVLPQLVLWKGVFWLEIPNISEVFTIIKLIWKVSKLWLHYPQTNYCLGTMGWNLITCTLAVLFWY